MEKDCTYCLYYLKKTTGISFCCYTTPSVILKGLIGCKNHICIIDKDCSIHAKCSECKKISAKVIGIRGNIQNK